MCLWVTVGARSNPPSWWVVGIYLNVVFHPNCGHFWLGNTGFVEAEWNTQLSIKLLKIYFMCSDVTCESVHLEHLRKRKSSLDLRSHSVHATFDTSAVCKSHRTHLAAHTDSTVMMQLIYDTSKHVYPHRGLCQMIIKKDKKKESWCRCFCFWKLFMICSAQQASGFLSSCHSRTGTF